MGSWQESSIMAEVRIMAENEVLFQKGSRTKYCRGVNGCVILLTYSVLGCCHSAVSHFNSVIARCGKAICLAFSWLTEVFTALQNIVGTKSVFNDLFGNKTAPAAEFTDRGCCFAHVSQRDGLLLVGEVEAVGLVPVAAGEVGHLDRHVAVEHGDCS